MTVSNAAAKTTPASGDGSTATFAVPFRFDATTDLVVVWRDHTTLVETVKTISTHYTVTGSGPPYLSGGNVVFTGGNIPPSTVDVIVYRASVQSQAVSVGALIDFPSAVITLLADKLTLIAQEIQERTSRCFRLSIFDRSGASLEIPGPVAGKAIRWNDAGTALINSTYNPDGSEAAAAASATAAAASASAASTSASAASASQTAAASSASAASTSQTAAAGSATASASSATSASTSASNASTSASAASASASAASTSQTAAAGSATAAASSATSASTSASGASTSATNAATSATNAATSATAAAGSATAAAASAASVNLRTVNSQAGNYTVVAGDQNKLIEYTGSGGNTITWDPATLGANFEFHIKHNGSGGTLTLDPAGTTTIDGATTQTLSVGQSVVCVVKNSTTTLITQTKGYGAVTSVATAGLATGGPITTTGTVTVTAAAVSDIETATGTTQAATPAAIATLFTQGTDISSNTTLTVPTTGGGYFNVTGTTTVTKINQATVATGKDITLQFSGALTLTHSSANLVLPGAANITTAAGDTAIFRCETTTANNQKWRCIAYTKASGLPIVATASVGRLLNVQTFTGNGTYTPTAGTNAALVLVVGAGGGGAVNAQNSSSAQVIAGAGGSGGGWSLHFINSGVTGQTITVGTGGTAASPTGGTSSFGAICSATGGTSGGGTGSGTSTVFSSGAAAVGGAGSSGNIANGVGCAGGQGYRVSGTVGAGGCGGGSYFGGGAAQQTSDGNGLTCATPGAGGGGSLSINAAGARSGGTGANGIVIVWEYS